MAARQIIVAVTFDSSFYIGALNSRGKGSRLMTLARTGQIRLDTSEAILRETFRVLREEFHRDGYRIEDASQKILGIANLVAPTQTLQLIAAKLYSQHVASGISFRKGWITRAHRCQAKMPAELCQRRAMF